MNIRKTKAWILLGTLAACGGGAAEPAAVSDVAEATAGAESAVEERTESRLFGEAPAEQGEPVALADIVASPEQWAGKTVLVEGTIGKVCERKGCWMDLSQGGVSVRIPMGGHRFFLPQDVVGHEALVQGTVRLLAEEEGEGAHEHAEGEHEHAEGEHAEGEHEHAEGEHEHAEEESCNHAAGRKVVIEASGVLVR